MRHTGKEIKLVPELFINKTFEYTFVRFVPDQSLRLNSVLSSARLIGKSAKVQCLVYQIIFVAVVLTNVSKTPLKS